MWRVWCGAWGGFQGYILATLAHRYPGLDKEVRELVAQDPSKRKLYVSNLDYRTTSDALHRAFQMFGRIVEGARVGVVVFFARVDWFLVFLDFARDGLFLCVCVVFFSSSSHQPPSFLTSRHNDRAALVSSPLVRQHRPNGPLSSGTCIASLAGAVCFFAVCLVMTVARLSAFTF